MYLLGVKEADTVFETDSHSVLLLGLEVTTQTRLTSDSEMHLLLPPGVGVKTCYHTGMLSSFRRLDLVKCYTVNHQSMIVFHSLPSVESMSL